MHESEHDDSYWDDIASEYDHEIATEEGYWQSQRVSMEMISVNAYLLQMKLNTILKALERLGFSQSELNALFKENVLEQLRNDRQMILKERDRANSDIAIAKKNLLGPDGTPLKI